MRGSYRQHRPGYIDGPDPLIGTFESTEQLLAVPFVALWAGLSNFVRFSIAHLSSDPALMAEFDDEFWVVALLQLDDSNVDLPEWDEDAALVKYHARRESRKTQP